MPPLSRLAARRDHLVVCGDNTIAARNVGKNEDAAGVPMARRLGLRVVIGETHREDILRAAGVTTCQALLSVTNSDSVNLETALHARALASDIRIVLGLGDDDLADRVQRSVGHTISRSVSYVAAPSFAAAMLEHQVLRTIAVGRHVLLIADLGVGTGSELDGTAVQAVHQTGLVRVLAVEPAGGGPVNWSPPGTCAWAPRTGST